MPASASKKPCHLLAGPLGVGKTTAILEYLARKEDGENIAVLVNDFGKAGIDEDVLRSGGNAQAGLELIPVPGGCLCCTSAVHFEVNLGRLSKAPEIDRIIIEPSGVVMLNQMKQLLLELGKKHALDIQPIIVLINLARFNERRFQEMPYFQMLAEEADVLVGNRRDLATDEQVEAFERFTLPLQEAGKRCFITSFARIPAEAFQPALSPSREASGPPGAHGVDDHYTSGSREWDAGVCFDHDRLLRSVTGWRDAAAKPGQERLKGIFRTNDGWKMVEVAQEQVYTRNFPARQVSSVDWIHAHGRAERNPEALLGEAILDG